MPFYEYQCNHCGHTLEAMQKISDSPLKKCPHCGKSQLQRLMSAPVFRLKGGGWYETDFKSDKDNKRNLADRPEAEAPKEDKKEDKKETAEAGSKDTATSESKTAAKAGRQTRGVDRGKPAAADRCDETRRRVPRPIAPERPPRRQSRSRSAPAKRPVRAAKGAAKPARRR